MSGGRDHRAITLVELLVALAIVSILSGLSLVAVQRAREAARRATCTSNLRQLGLGLLGYHNSHQRFPSGRVADSGPYPAMSWSVQTYAYLDEEPLWLQAIKDYAASKRFELHAGFGHPVSTFSCPSDGRADTAHLTRFMYLVAPTNYLGVLGTDFNTDDGVLFLDSRIRIRDISRGTTHTLLVGERPSSQDYYWGWLYAGEGQNATGSGDMTLGVKEINSRIDLAERCPLNRLTFRPGDLADPCSVLHFWSMHPGGAHFVYADGHVAFKSYDSHKVLEKEAIRSKRGTP